MGNKRNGQSRKRGQITQDRRKRTKARTHIMHDYYGELQCKVVGSVSFDPKLAKMELEGKKPISGELHKDVEHLVRTLELFLSDPEIDFL